MTSCSFCRTRPSAACELLVHLANVRCKLLDGSQVAPSPGHTGVNSFIEAVAMLAAHESSWLRPLEHWRPRSKNAWRQFGSLARHLLARYDLPAFFDSVWFSGRNVVSLRHQSWYIHIGQGGSLRDCDLPIPYTKRMAHFFMQAPRNATVSQAIRWGQVLGLGGDSRLATTLFATRLGERFDHDDFWSNVIRWFIANPLLESVHVQPIVDYLHHQRFELVDVQVNNRLQQQPLQPNLTMTGRTAASLLRQVEAWHRRLAQSNTVQVQHWRPVGLAGLALTEGQKGTVSWRQWLIRELLSTPALVAEGRAMRHCVASDTSSCAQGRSSIWTMERKSLAGLEKCLTIEVHPATRMICQIRGRRNRQATDQELRVVRHWADQAGLRLASYV